MVFQGVARLLLNSLSRPRLNSPSLVAHMSYVAVAGFGDGKYVSFEDRQWHQPCFKCSRCSVGLVGSGFFPDRDLILCTDCNNDDWPALMTPVAPAPKVAKMSNTANNSRETSKPQLCTWTLQYCKFTYSVQLIPSSVFTAQNPYQPLAQWNVCINSA